MSWAGDTDKLLEDGVTVVVKEFTSTFLSSTVYPTLSSASIETSTVLIFPKSGAYRKEIKGEVIENTHLLFFPATSSVAVGHRVYESGDSNYHEVLDVRKYDGHYQVYTLKVEGR